eukprot:681033-Pleurochrysis_carterae.AAC.1
MALRCALVWEACSATRLRKLVRLAFIRPPVQEGSKARLCRPDNHGGRRLRWLCNRHVWRYAWG